MIDRYRKVLYQSVNTHKWLCVCPLFSADCNQFDKQYVPTALGHFHLRNSFVLKSVILSNWRKNDLRHVCDMRARAFRWNVSIRKRNDRSIQIGRVEGLASLSALYSLHFSHLQREYYWRNFELCFLKTGPNFGIDRTSFGLDLSLAIIYGYGSHFLTEHSIMGIDYRLLPTTTLRSTRFQFSSRKTPRIEKPSILIWLVFRKLPWKW